MMPAMPSGPEMAVISLRGPDSPLRDLAWTLLEMKLIERADRIDIGSPYLDDKGRWKMASTGVAMELLCARARVAEVLAIVRASPRADGIRGHVLPVLELV